MVVHVLLKLFQSGKDKRKHRQLVKTGLTCLAQAEIPLNSENIVFETMVDKLQLKTQKHPFPYRTRWIKDIV